MQVRLGSEEIEDLDEFTNFIEDCPHHRWPLSGVMSSRPLVLLLLLFERNGLAGHLPEGEADYIIAEDPICSL